MRIMRKMFLWSIILAVLIGVYATYIERNLLITENHNLQFNKNGNDRLKVVQFTDTQLGEFYSIDQLEKAVNKINEQNADIVVFTGDLIDNAASYEDINKVAAVLSKIKCNISKYAIYGNHDYGGGAVRYYNNIMAESGFTILKNDNNRIKFKNKYINIFGADDGLLGNNDINKTMKNVNEDDINILLLHEPDLADKYSKYPIDLILSGHSHGGQVYIPFYGPLVKNTLSEKYSKGFYKITNKRKTKLYVNSGLGNTKAPFRLFNIPQVSTFNIKI
ncbi:MAG: metallophosphoesterase [Clostridium sp.]|uniref:metallophosphoesterase n=1 Tax=Clostridium sp. TaxID=1506 RepID=UPI003F3AD811